MANIVQQNHRQKILGALGKYHRCMVEALPDELDRLLEPHYTLTHITGYVQPKQEWLAAIKSGEFDYHRIELMPESLSVSVNGDAAVVIGRGVFYATIQGLNAPWRLAFNLQYTNHDGNWLAASACYSTFS